jgi:SAM-dependent methyltransferase
MRAYYDVIASEREFHNRRFSEDSSRQAQDKYYWAVQNGFRYLDSLVEQSAAQSDVLIYGCGTTNGLSELAPTAKSVVGIDISEEAIKHQVAHCTDANVSFRVMDAMNMDFAGESFDLVCGAGILHHLDIRAASREIARVLRTDGKAIFWEPLGINPAFNFYRAVTPNARTPDEHPLKLRDFAILREHFSSVETEFFGLTTLVGVPVRKLSGGETLRGALERLDQVVLTAPGLRLLAWCCLIVLKK